MAILLLSVHHVPNQGLYRLQPTHMTELPTFLLEASTNDGLSKGQ